MTRIAAIFRNHLIPYVFIMVVIILLFDACVQIPAESPGSSPAEDARASTGERYGDYDIITVLPRDAIPAIDDPVFISVDEADEAYFADELILGVEINGDSRAYSIPMLSSHEIVNDVVGGRKIAVTW